MKKNLFTLVMAILAIACSSVIVSCGNDANELPSPDKGTKGIHRIEATFSGDTKNWTAGSQYVGYVTNNSFSELSYETTGLIGYRIEYDEITGMEYPIAIMKDPVDVVITTKEECERLVLSFGCYYKKIYDDDADLSSTLTVNFKGYVDGRLIKSYTKTFIAGQHATIGFNSIDHPNDGEYIVESK